MDGYRANNAAKAGLHVPLIKRSIFACLLWLSLFAHAEPTRYEVEIDAKSTLKTLLEPHLDLTKWRDNARMSPTEWARLTNASPEQIRALLATEGYFNPRIDATNELRNDTLVAKLVVQEGPPTLIQQVDIQFIGAISEQGDGLLPTPEKLRAGWPLKKDMPFRQESWSDAKRALLTQLLMTAYPNASITQSKASIDPSNNTAKLLVVVDSGQAIRFGDISVKGLSRYPESVVRNLNPIKPGRIYQQEQLLLFQTRLQESRYFRSAEVVVDTKASAENQLASDLAPIQVTVEENPAVTVTTGLGFSTNTGARSQATIEHLNLFNRSWRTSTSLRLEQRLQALTGSIRFPTTDKGYRDSINATANHTSIEGQRVTTTDVGFRRAWGTRKREQYIGANFINEHISLDGGESSDNYAATVQYGITLRRTDNDLNPTRGYLLNAQFASAPLSQLANGSFLQSYLKVQTYYPITASTQLIARAELGMVSGKNSAPAAFLFRTGGDQSVRGYAFQSLGITDGDAIIGARYLATGSLEVVQWLAAQWGAAVFVDAGNAANTWQTLKPVYGYGMGARWKSPVGPIGADIAYGQATEDYRLHFNIGVMF